MAEVLRTFYITIAVNQGGPGYMTVTTPLTGYSDRHEQEDYKTAREKVFNALRTRWSFMYYSLDEIHENDRVFLGVIE